MNHTLLALTVSLTIGAFASAQTCITSPFTGGSGGNAGGAVYFDAQVNPANGVTFTSMDLNLDTAPISSTVGCEIYARFGSSHVGNEGAPGWFYITRGTGTMAGSGAPTTMTFASTFWLPNGLNALAVVATDGASHDYTVGNGSNQMVSNADLTLTFGSSSNAPFTSSIFTPRVANTTLCYTLGGGASYPWFDASARVGGAPLMVDFTDRSWSGHPSGIQLWQWDFDSDGTFEITGNTPAEQNPSWVFAAPGIYSVTLEIVDGFGFTPRTRTGLVTVGAPTNNTNSADLLHYTFNEPPRAGDMKVFNAASSDIAPLFGTMTNGNWQGDPSRNGFQASEPGFGCLGEAGVISMNALDTGLALDVDSMTIAWWHRIGQTGANTANAFTYVFGGPGDSMRCYIDGNAGNGHIRYAGTAVGNLTNISDIKTGLADQWTHLALVVDNAAGTATWYVNGVADGSNSFPAGTHAVSRSEFWVGFHNGTQNYSLFYSMDDFRLYSRALSPAEVATIANGTEPAVATRQGTGCPGAGMVVPAIGASGGPPALGNTAFGVDLADAEPGTPTWMVLGTFCNQLGTGGGALPLDLSAFNVGFASGCNLEIGGVITTLFSAQTNGTDRLPVPIPSFAGLAGIHIYAQWGVLGSVVCVSDALDISIQ